MTGGGLGGWGGCGPRFDGGGEFLIILIVRKYNDYNGLRDSYSHAKNNSRFSSNKNNGLGFRTTETRFWAREYIVAHVDKSVNLCYPCGTRLFAHG